MRRTLSKEQPTRPQKTRRAGRGDQPSHSPSKSVVPDVGAGAVPNIEAAVGRTTEVSACPGTLVSQRYYRHIFWFLLICGAVPCFGSTVVIWLNSEGIVAAADSLERDEAPTGNQENRTCKIQAVGRFYIASTGIPIAYIQGRTLYSSVETARSVVNDGIDLEDMVSKFIEVTEPKFQRVMSLIFQQDRNKFMARINGKEGALAVAIFEIRQDGPRLALLDFTATATYSGIRIDHSPPQYCPGDCDIVQGAVPRLGSQNARGVAPSPSNVEDAIPWVTNIVKSEIDIDKLISERDKIPRVVDGPISVLVLTRNVTRWPDGYHETCPEK